MASELEHAQYAQHAKHLDNAASVVEVLVALVGYEQVEVVGQNGDEIDEVEHALGELPLIRRGPRAQQVLEREPGDTRRLDQLEARIVRERVVHVVHRNDLT